MAVLLLFASAREAAGTGREEVDGSTVGEVLAAARARHGEVFSQVVAASRVWRNGEPAADDDPVGPDDEVAVLPPVSGGSTPPAGGLPPVRGARPGDAHDAAARARSVR